MRWQTKQKFQEWFNGLCPEYNIDLNCKYYINVSGKNKHGTNFLIVPCDIYHMIPGLSMSLFIFNVLFWSI